VTREIEEQIGYIRMMKSGERNVLKSLVAVAWADGKLEQGETGVIEGLLCSFDATEAEEQEILEYARSRRTLADVPVSQLSQDDRDLLLSNAALLTHIDGEQTDRERRVLEELTVLLGFSPERAKSILDSVREGAETLSNAGPRSI
jgi:tellurite resistance protein